VSDSYCIFQPRDLVVDAVKLRVINPTSPLSRDSTRQQMKRDGVRPENNRKEHLEEELF